MSLALVALALVAVCDTLALPPALREGLKGTWTWVRAVDVDTREVHTPETEGCTARLTVGPPDSDGEGDYGYRRSDGRTVDGRCLTWGDVSHGFEALTISAPVDFLTEAAHLWAASDMLRLEGVFEGGYEVGYAREP